MTTASEIITAAYRESNLVAISGSPTTAETTEALARLNSLIPGVLGSEVGEELSDLTIGGEFDQSAFVSDHIPANVRLQLNLTAARTLYLDQRPYDGQRVAVTDAGYTLDTYNLTLNGHGRRIEATATVVLSTEGLSRQWMYRADTGNWVRLTGLLAADEMPFPVEFDDYFIIELALRLNPRHSVEIAPASMMRHQNQASQIQARYRKPRRVQDWGSLGLLGQGGRNLGGELL